MMRARQRKIAVTRHPATTDTGSQYAERAAVGSALQAMNTRQEPPISEPISV
jgi:hypothetical protein